MTSILSPADPDVVALVLPVLLQIGRLQRDGWPIDYSDPPFLPPNWHPCSECAAFRWAGCNKVSAGIHTGWCRSRLVPVPPDARRLCFTALHKPHG